MKLPELPIQSPKKELQVYSLKGLNRSDDFAEGTLFDCENITSKRFPYFTTRKNREPFNNRTNVTAITAWDSLLEVDGTNLYYGNELCGQVTAGEKQFAVVNTKIVIFPDKKYFDIPTKQLVDMVDEFSFAYPMAIVQVGDKFQTITLIDGYDQYAPLFQNYRNIKPDEYESVVQRETVFVTLIGENEGTWEGELQYLGIQKDTHFTQNDLIITFRNDNIITMNSAVVFRMKRVIPDFDYICSYSNRVFGCVSKEQTIYASAVGDPLSFKYINTQDTSSSWIVNVGTPSEFTGCASLGSAVLFFKEHVIHKVLGSLPSDFRLFDYEMDGVKAGCHKSIQAINDSLYYLSPRGVMVFSGQAAVKISDELGSAPLSNGVAGADGVRYYLSCTDGEEYRLFTFDIKRRIWLAEDHAQVTDFTRYGNKLLMVVDNKIIYEGDESLEDDWFLQFNDIYESRYNNYGNRVGTILNKKYFSKIILRVQLSEYAVIKVRCDGGRWTQIGEITAKEGVFSHVVPINRCDKFGIRIEGHGDFTLQAMTREYIAGSVRNE